MKNGTIIFFWTAGLFLGACGGGDPSKAPPPDPSPPKDITAFDPTVLPAAPAGTGGANSGATVFATCAACHQQNGQGLAGTYPPLAGSEWATANAEVPIRIVLKGLQGSITVRGANYNGVMTPFENIFSDAEIASVLTYVRSQWGNNATAVTPEQVASVRAAVQDRKTAWDPAELKPLM